MAELMGGTCNPFGPLEGAFMATSGDAHGTMIEVYPERATLDIPDSDDQVVFGENKTPPIDGLVHLKQRVFPKKRTECRLMLRMFRIAGGP